MVNSVSKPRERQDLDSHLAAGESSDREVLGKDPTPDLALQWIVRLRYGMVFGGAAILLAVAYAYWPDRLLLWALAPLAAALSSNIVLDCVPRMALRFPHEVLGAVFVLDALCLTTVLGLTGGPMNPFSLLYLVQITLSVVLLKKVWTWILGGLSAVCFGSLFFLHVPFAAFPVSPAERGASPHLVGMWVAFIVAATLITFFTGRVSDVLRLREREVLALQERIAKQERLASLVTLAAGTAHELGTPLGTIAIVARELELYATKSLGNGTIVEDICLISSEVRRCREILNRMSLQGAEPAGEALEDVGVGDLLDALNHSLPQPMEARVEFPKPVDLPILSIPRHAVLQALSVLVKNAVESSEPEAPVQVQVQQAGEFVRFVVKDHGRGMSPETLRRLGEPFFTTKAPGKGMGLGIFLARTLAERLGGQLTYESSEDTGTKAVLEIPITLRSELVRE